MPEIQVKKKGGSNAGKCDPDLCRMCGTGCDEAGKEARGRRDFEAVSNRRHK